MVNINYQLAQQEKKEKRVERDQRHELKVLEKRFKEKGPVMNDAEKARLIDLRRKWN